MPEQGPGHGTQWVLEEPSGPYRMAVMVPWGSSGFDVLLR